MDQQMHFDGGLSNWTQHNANKKKRGKERIFCQVVPSVKFNATIQKGVTSKGHLKQGVVYSGQIKDKLSSSLNLATDCFLSVLDQEKKIYLSSIPPTAM